MNSLAAMLQQEAAVAVPAPAAAKKKKPEKGVPRNSLAQMLLKGLQGGGDDCGGGGEEEKGEEMKVVDLGRVHVQCQPELDRQVSPSPQPPMVIDSVGSPHVLQPRVMPVYVEVGENNLKVLVTVDNNGGRRPGIGRGSGADAKQQQQQWSQCPEEAPPPYEFP
jgi:hypothetical protein